MMSSMLALLCVGWFAFTAAGLPKPEPYSLEDAHLHFERFIQEFGRNYADHHEKHSRFQIFKENLEKINKMNEISKHGVFGITQFSDQSQEELTSKFGGLKEKKIGDDSGCKYIHDGDINYKDAPESWDWREHGVVTPVKDQVTCGSCYAFSAIGSVESQYALKYNNLIRLSEQQIVDCDKSNSGCQGGHMSLAMRWLINQGGSMTEEDYPYTNGAKQCRFDANKVAVRLSDCRSYNLTSQEKLKQLLYHKGPIAISIKGPPLFLYKSGLIDDELCNVGNLDHGVLLVGYGSDEAGKFWIVKNSWGEKFGEKGYFRMHRGENCHSCGMMNQDMASAVF